MKLLVCGYGEGHVILLDVDGEQPLLDVDLFAGFISLLSWLKFSKGGGIHLYFLLKKRNLSSLFLFILFIKGPIHDCVVPKSPNFMAVCCGDGVVR